MTSPFAIPNVRRFVAFRVLFNARFYYPVFTVLFLDFGLSLEQFALLNVAWAASIIVLEVPSGALADVIGRRNLVVAAAAIMVVEMAILCFAPTGNPSLLFSLFLVNRVLSGAAEAAASGADEALAYDSLAQAGMSEKWPRVIEVQMRAQSLAFIVASTVGAAVYDPALLQTVADAMRLPVTLTQGVTLRFPLYLCLLSAVGAFLVTLRMKEVVPEGTERPALCRREIVSTLGRATRHTLEAGRWIVRTPVAVAIILWGVTLDSMIRLFLTLNSQYYRVIELPEASFGVIGSVLSILGLVVPGLARRLAETRTPRFNLVILAVIAWLGIYGLTFTLPYLGLLPVILLFAAMFLMTFFVSHYLNLITDSSHRATVLSFRGLVFNIGYGAIGILYALLLAARRPEVRAAFPGEGDGHLEDLLFIDTLQIFPGYFAVTLLLAAGLTAVILRRSTFHRSVRT